MSELGDLTSFLEENPSGDLSWADLSEEDLVTPTEESRVAVDTDLQAELFAGGTTSTLIHSNVDLNLARGYVAPKTAQYDLEGLRRTASLLLMQSPCDTGAWVANVKAKFLPDTLREGKSILATTLAERGLLGGYYINASDFPQCLSSKEAVEFVKKYAGSAPFIREKSACQNCPNKKDGKCNSFGKSLVAEVPYTDQLAEQTVVKQAALGYVVPSEALPPRDRIRIAHTQKPETKPVYSGVSNQNGSFVPVSRLLHKTAIDQNQLDSLPVVATIRQELLKGKTQVEVARSLTATYSDELLSRTASHWSPLYSEAGLFGKLYITQDSFSSCQAGADFLAKHASTVRTVLAGQKCSSCTFKNCGSCAIYGRPLTASLQELYTQATVDDMRRHVLAKGADKTASSLSAGSIKDTLRHLCTLKPATNQRRVASSVPVGNQIVARKRAGMSPINQASVVASARELLNEGLHGKELAAALIKKHTAGDVKAAFPMVQGYLADQGIQGTYYIDPSVYADYGRTCATAKAKFAGNSVEFVLAGPKCATCVHQVVTGQCSVLRKALIADVPSETKELLRAQKSAAPVRTKTASAPTRDFADEFGVVNNLDIELKAQSKPFTLDLEQVSDDNDELVDLGG